MSADMSQPPAHNTTPHNTTPLRVVSLLPSATEIVALLLAEQDGTAPPAGGRRGVALVGRSHECDHPAALVEHLPVLTAAKTTFTTSAEVDSAVRAALAAGTGLYTVDRGLLEQLAPDVIITQSLCSVCSVDFCLVERIAAGLPSRPRLVDLNPQSLGDVLTDIVAVGDALGLQRQAAVVVQRLQARVDEATSAAEEALHGGGGGGGEAEPSLSQRPSVAFLEWLEPIFIGGHWTPEIIHLAGGSHPLNPPRDGGGSGGGGAGKSFVVTPEALSASNPDWIIACPCGLDLETVRKELASALAGKPWWRDLAAVREGRVALVDGNAMFNRPGPRLVDALEFCVGLLHGRPDLIPPDFPWARYSA